MRIAGRTAVVAFCALLALALVAGAGAAGKAFAHRDCGKAGDCGKAADCGKAGGSDCCGNRCGDGGRGNCGHRGGQEPCEKCREASGGADCGEMHGKGPAPSMMEGMKGHAADVRKRVEALRKSEKALAGISDPAAFRAAVVEHLKLVDDLQEAHVRHMESMPGKMSRGEKPCDQPCPQAKEPPPPAAK